MPTLTVNSHQVFYADGGRSWVAEQPSVVLVHAAAVTHTAWQQQSRALAHHGFNVAAVDLPGHGRSENSAGLDTVEDLADWLAEFLAVWKREPVLLVGHSLGAAIALTLAANHPACVKALVLVGCGLRIPVNAGLLEDCSNNPARAIEFITKYGHAKTAQLGASPVPGASLIGTALALMAPASSAVLRQDFEACNHWDGSRYASRIACPALIVQGKSDRMTPLTKAGELTAQIPGASMTVLPGIGHMVPGEAPRELLNLLRDFFKLV